jgi:hypothetical protein
MNIVELIDRAYDNDAEEKPRRYIGASIAGSPCDAYLELSLRGFPDNKIKPRLRRIMSLGHKIEDIVIADLKKAGINVIEKDFATGKQFTYQAFGGHVTGHADGIIDAEGVAILLEVKSMGEKYFDQFLKFGVKKSHPKYFDQVQTMMGLSGMREAMLVGYNKNTSQYGYEVVPFDEFHFMALKVRFEKILNGGARRAASDNSDWRCRGCFKSDACWGKKEPPVTCASCKFASPTLIGGWDCGQGQSTLFGPCRLYQKFEPQEKK